MKVTSRITTEQPIVSNASNESEPVRVWSPEQQAAFDWAERGTGNAILSAVAGAGKTTTLVEMIKRFLARDPSLSIALCAYNKKMGDELKAKTSNIAGVTAGTLHSFGFAALRRARGRVNVDDKKVQQIVWKYVDTITYRHLKGASQFLVKLVGLAKDSGFGYVNSINDPSSWRAIIDHHDLSVENEFEEKYGELIDFAIRVLDESNADRTNIDFADMIYQTLVHGVPVQQYDVVMVDEAQDTNPTRRALAAKMLRSGGRFVAVGDPCQAIFGFTGADSDSLEQIKRQFNAIELPLHASYRCPRKVVEFARQWVSHITPVATAADGDVRSITYDELLSDVSKLQPTDAMLCRKTAPLVSTAFALIRKGVGCRIEGRDIGMQLVNLVRKYRVRSIADLRRRIEDYRVREITKAQAKGMEGKAAQIADRCETLEILMQRADEQKLDVEGLVTMIQSMFGDSDNDRRTLLTLSTVHKAKGREWDRVFLLGRREFMPSKWAKQLWQIEQERNLIYVAVTRAKRELVEVEGFGG